jgi:hypothetical protein
MRRGYKFLLSNQAPIDVLRDEKGFVICEINRTKRNEHLPAVFVNELLVADFLDFACKRTDEKSRRDRGTAADCP